MKILFLNGERLVDGIKLVSDELGFEICDKNADIMVEITEKNENILSVSLDGDKAAISYGGGKARFFRGLSTLMGWIKKGEKTKDITEYPIFATNGAMVDQSRNDVMKSSTVKTMMRKMALMGMNMYMLYTEDVYEIEGRPYFGYMRGRYTREELKELDTYGIKLGIELIPCIQTLGHLSNHLRWSTSAPYRDTANVLLAGAESTYAFIDDMLRTVSECFTTKRVHIGMDETNGLGLGSYLGKNGYRDACEIYFEHLERVIKIAESYGLKPMMWSDMFFRLAGRGLENYSDYDVRVEFSDKVIEKIPKGIRQVFWDYYRSNEEFYDINIKKHEKTFGKGTIFAGGVWCWGGHCPQYSRSLRNTLPALDACKNNGVKEIIATVWNNGSECLLMLSLLGLAWYADYDYRGGYDAEGVKECFENSCGVSYDELMLCELPGYIDGDKRGITRALLYNDPLIGLVDKHIEGLETQSYYVEVTEKLTKASANMGIFAAAYEVVTRLSSLLENKADFGVRLRNAYLSGDREALEDMVSECDVIMKKINDLRLCHRKAWHMYNKPFGWEVHDIRYGGLANRFDTVKERISSYLSGELVSLPELYEPRLRLDGRREDEYRFTGFFDWEAYRGYASADNI